MFSAANLHRMSTRSPKPALPADSPARLIAARRAQLGYSLDKVAELTEDVIYRQLLWRVENGHKPADSLTSKQVQALLSALEWTHDEWLATLAVDTIPATPVGNAVLITPNLNQDNLRRIPVYDL